MLEGIPAGIYPPLPTFFMEDEELDLATLRRHVQALNGSGIAGYVVMGSNGESVHLNGDERARVIETVRAVAGREVPLIAGCGEQSTRATIANCRQAAASGADVALILPGFYFKSRMNTAALLAHYRAIADSSPLPVVIYNMPANAAGLDLDASTIIALAEHPNIIGFKDSSGNMAKLAQVVAATDPSHFRAFAGSAGYLLPALTVGAMGAVAALANIFPREVCRVQELFNAGQLAEARVLQARLAPANTAVTTTYSVPGLKAALELVAGYGGRPRLPLWPLTDQERRQLAVILAGVQG
ncbi:MAG TPA: dihydrodipicolinate synthase family protein [Ktedonobacteraceae bacterium]|nr:dihydrodipicolinate synthase family protein [Ktedonobacteraceae bacterium]